MKILALAQVEDREPIAYEIAKQSVPPYDIQLYLDESPAKELEMRRMKIAYNHRELQRIVETSEADLIWQVEGDSVLPINCLERLLESYEKLKGPDFGYVSGGQIGRHGVYMIGAWHFNEDRSEFWSANYKLRGIQEVDATGLYCLLAPKDVWLKGQCKWNYERWGPDSNFGLSLKEQGYKVYIDMDLRIGHKTEAGIIYPDHISTCNVRFFQSDGRWKYRTS